MPSPKLQYFDYEHLPPHLQTISKPVGDLARQLDAMLPDGSQKELGMQSLLDAKDRFVRAALPIKGKPPADPEQERRVSVAAALLGAAPGDIDEIKIPGPAGDPTYAYFLKGRRMEGGKMTHKGVWSNWNGTECWPDTKLPT